MRYEGEGSRRRGHPDSADRRARPGLGWFSIGLGLVELAAPRFLTRRFGMEGSEGLIQAYGAREIANGIAILAADDPTPWVWARVGGDARGPRDARDRPRRRQPAARATSCWPSRRSAA